MKLITRECENRDQAQALAGFLWNEMQRHLADVNVIQLDLMELKHFWGVEPKCQREFVKPKLKKKI